MEDVPQISQKYSRPFQIKVNPYYRDHYVEDTVVLPAVEAIQILGEVLREDRPNTVINQMTAIHFDKFLFIPPKERQIAASVEINVHNNGDLTVRLQTKHKAKKSAITRTKEHAVIRYPKKKIDEKEPPLDLNAALEGICFDVPSGKIYRDLIPFGPTYQNVKELYISEYGAVAKIVTPNIGPPYHSSFLLGSPFLLDAAFHAACVWGQRFAKTVTFPVGIDKRLVHVPSLPGETYYSRIFPVSMDPKQLDFDIWIYGKNGNLVESVYGIHMRDVSGGRVRPPQWIVGGGHSRLDRIRSRCRAVSLIEIKTVMPFAEKALSNLEKERFMKMGAKRRKSFLSARLALKHLFRNLVENEADTPPDKITTLAADMQRPFCSRTEGSSFFPCSVSHDDRFTIAVASVGTVGVDVEKLSPRVLKSVGLFMSDNEQGLIHHSKMDAIEVAIRIWSIKEAVTKAFDINLSESWKRVEVVTVGQYESEIQIDHQDRGHVFHDIEGLHVFTLFVQ